MDRLKLLLIACVIITVFSINAVSCIECYVCTTQSNENCLDPAKNGLEAKECTRDALTTTKELATKLHRNFSALFEISIDARDVPSKCLKTVTKVKGREYVLRGCQITSTKLDLCKKLEEERNVTIVHCTFCDGNACNNANRLTMAPASSLFVLLIAFGASRELR